MMDRRSPPADSAAAGAEPASPFNRVLQNACQSQPGSRSSVERSDSGRYLHDRDDLAEVAVRSSVTQRDTTHATQARRAGEAIAHDDK
jgi:hypothetical protein